MKRYTAQQPVGEGIYFNPRRLAFRSMEEPGPLPGREGETYLRVPAPVLLLIGLPLSVAYLIFLPVIGFVMLFGAVLEKLRHRGEAAVRRAETEGARTLNVHIGSFGTRAGRAAASGGAKSNRRAA